ncbi:MAG: ACT domain-containing protein [Planctomycetaceae bacterium]
MAKEYIITMTAANRVGILSAVTKAMAELDGDLREASQTVVRGFFTMIFSAEFPEQLDSDVICAHLQDACRPFGIDFGLKDPANERLRESINGSSRLYSLRLGGLNQPGVLRQLSSVMALHRIDIAGMHAVRTGDSTGFEMVMKIAVPVDFDIDSLLRELHETGEPFQMTADISDYTDHA